MQEGPETSTETGEDRPDVEILILGAGFSGLGMAIRCLQSGRSSFLILERAHDLGGTWRDNAYPGCACDVPSRLYSFSFELNPDWSRAYAGQEEIWRYLKDCVQRHHLEPYLRLGWTVARARFDEFTGLWSVESTDGRRLRCRYLVASATPLGNPYRPPIPGLEDFEGPSFHTATWDHGVDLQGKTVAVVGTGASAVQCVPAIAPEVGRLILFQRTLASQQRLKFSVGHRSRIIARQEKNKRWRAST